MSIPLFKKNAREILAPHAVGSFTQRTKNGKEIPGIVNSGKCADVLPGGRYSVEEL